MTLFREGFSGPGFLLCVGAGFFTAAVYDLLRVLRRILRPGKRTVFVLDLFFCLLAVSAAFLVSLPVSFGRIRLFQLAAQGIGAAAYALSAWQVTEVWLRAAEKLFSRCREQRQTRKAVKAEKRRRAKKAPRRRTQKKIVKT